MSQKDLSALNHVNFTNLLRDAAISNKLGYAYIPIGKAANTNIKRWLWGLECEHGYPDPVPKGYFQVHNHGWKYLQGQESSPWQVYGTPDVSSLVRDAQQNFLFTAVRNPYARLLSGYLDKVRNPKETHFTLRNRFNMPHANMSFSEFVHVVSEQCDQVCNLHWSTQSYASAYHCMAYNEIGFVESLHDDLARISKKIFNATCTNGLKKKAKHAVNAQDKLNAFYNKKLAAIVYERYEDDFQTFGYSEDYAQLAPIREARPSGTCASITEAAIPLIESFSSPDLLGASAGAKAAEALLSRLEAFNVKPGSARYLQLYAVLLLERTDKTRAINLEKDLQKNSPSHDDLLAALRARIHASQFVNQEKAVDVLEQGLAYVPDSRHLLKLAAKLSKELGRDVNAKRFARRYKKLHGEDNKI